MPSTLSAATLNDLRFTLIDGSYVVSAVDPSSITGAVDIPAIHKGLPVTKIGNFSNSKITSVTIPKSITTIRRKAFYNCYSLTKFSIPQDSQLERIGNSAFYMCFSLADIDLPKSLYWIGPFAFTGLDKLTTITIPTYVMKIPEGAFLSCRNLSNVTMHGPIEKIGESAFAYNYALKIITLPDTLETIGTNAFLFSGLIKDVQIPSGVTSIGDNAFTACYDLPSVFFFGPAPGIGTDPFQQAGSKVGGFTIYVLPDFEDSFASWKKHYNIKVR